MKVKSQKLKLIFDYLMQVGKKNLPTLLTVASCLASIKAVIDAAGKGPELQKELAKAKANKKDGKLTKSELFVIYLKIFWPIVIEEGISIATCVGANSINLHRQAALMAAYAATETNFKEYKDNVVKTFGDKKAKEVDTTACKNTVGKSVVEDDMIASTGFGTQLCFDQWSGRYFYCSNERINFAQNEVNKRINTELQVSLNTFYELLGLDPVDLGETKGWIGTKEGGELLEVRYNSCVTANQRTALVLIFDVPDVLPDTIF